MSEQDFDALVSALREQAKAMDRLAVSIGQMAAAIVMMVDGEDDEPAIGTYLDGSPR